MNWFTEPTQLKADKDYHNQKQASYHKFKPTAQQELDSSGAVEYDPAELDVAEDDDRWGRR